MCDTQFVPSRSKRSPHTIRTTLAVALAFYCLQVPTASASAAGAAKPPPSLCTLTMTFDPTAIPNGNADSIAAARTSQTFRIRAYDLQRSYDPSRRSAAAMLDANATIEYRTDEIALRR